ncbi:MAG TPA: O-antigen ligase family protein [Acidisarcina sp.]
MNDRIYKAAVVGLMLTLMGVVMGIASPGLSDTDLGVVDNSLHLPVIITTGLFYAIILSRMVTHPARVLTSLAAAKTLLPILMFCVVSGAWSSDPGTTLRRALFLALTSLIGIIIGGEYDVPELARLLALASLIHIFATACLFAVSRHLLYSPSDPFSLKGLTTHKNIFGFEMGLAFLTMLLVPFRRLENLRWPLAAIALFLLLLSRSSGSLVATVFALLFVPFLLVLRFPSSQRVPVVLIALAALGGLGFLVVENAALLPAIFSKDTTLSGRTELWSLVVIAIGHHPMLGYGFDAFWQGLQGDSLTIIRGVGWLVPTAHNGYLDLLLGVGVVGALLFLLALVQFFARALRYAAAEQSSARFYPFVLLVFWLVYNLNESALLSRSGISYLLFCAITTSLGLRLAARHAAHPAPQAFYGAPAGLSHGLPNA